MLAKERMTESSCTPPYRPLISIPLLERAWFDVAPSETGLGPAHPLTRHPAAERPWNLRPYGRNLPDDGRPEWKRIERNFADKENLFNLLDLLGLDWENYDPATAVHETHPRKIRKRLLAGEVEPRTRETDAVELALVAATLHADDVAAKDVRSSVAQEFLTALASLLEAADAPGMPNWHTMPDDLDAASVKAAEAILGRIRGMEARTGDKAASYVVRSLGIVPPGEDDPALRIEPLPEGMGGRMDRLFKTWAEVEKRAVRPEGDVVWRLMGAALHEARCTRLGFRPDDVDGRRTERQWTPDMDGSTLPPDGPSRVEAGAAMAVLTLKEAVSEGLDSFMRILTSRKADWTEGVDAALAAFNEARLEGGDVVAGKGTALVRLASDCIRIWNEFSGKRITKTIETDFFQFFAEVRRLATEDLGNAEERKEDTLGWKGDAGLYGGETPIKKAMAGVLLVRQNELRIPTVYVGLPNRTGRFLSYAPRDEDDLGPAAWRVRHDVTHSINEDIFVPVREDERGRRG